MTACHRSDLAYVRNIDFMILYEEKHKNVATDVPYAVDGAFHLRRKVPDPIQLISSHHNYSHIIIRCKYILACLVVIRPHTLSFPPELHTQKALTQVSKQKRKEAHKIKTNKTSHTHTQNESSKNTHHHQHLPNTRCLLHLVNSCRV